jgi:hypothetical protein
MIDMLLLPYCKYCSYAVRILGSKLSSRTLNDEQAVLQALRQDLELRGKAQDAARCVCV